MNIKYKVDDDQYNVVVHTLSARQEQRSWQQNIPYANSFQRVNEISIGRSNLASKSQTGYRHRKKNNAGRPRTDCRHGRCGFVGVGKCAMWVVTKHAYLVVAGLQRNLVPVGDIRNHTPWKFLTSSTTPRREYINTTMLFRNLVERVSMLPCSAQPFLSTALWRNRALKTGAEGVISYVIYQRCVGHMLLYIVTAATT